MNRELYVLLERVRVWITAARPATLWASIAPVILGTALAHEDRMFHGPSAFYALVCSVLIQVGTNYANDYFDAVKGVDTEDRIGPTRATQAGLVARWQMLLASVGTFVPAFVLGLYLVDRGGIPILIIGITSIACGLLYTAGPYPLGYIGLGDPLVLLFFGPVAVWGTYYVQAQMSDPLPIIAGLSPGLLSTAILTVNNLRDIDSDRRTGKRTLAVRFGRTFSKFEYLGCIIVGSVGIPWYLCRVHNAHWWAMAASSTAVLAIPSVYRVFFHTDGPSLNHTLASTGKLLLVFSILFSAGWIIS